MNLHPVSGNPFHLPWREDLSPQQIAVRLGQLLDEKNLNKFKQEVQNSPLAPMVKSFIEKEFHSGSTGSAIKESVKYMMNYHQREISSVGFVFDWVLRNRELRDQRMGR